MKRVLLLLLRFYRRHVSPGLPVGTVGVQYGKAYAASDMFTVVIRGCFPGEEVKPEPNCEAGSRMLIPMGVFSALIVLLGVFSGPIISYLEALAGSLL